jgi:toxin CcdB
MARPAGRQFALYRMPKGGRGYLVDVQADRLSHFRFRVVVPLLPAEVTPPELPRLNPRIQDMGESFVFAPNAIATVPVSELGRQVGDLADCQDAFAIALEVLLKGFP